MKFKDKLLLIVSLDRPPFVISISSAIGVMIGVSPYIGLHTVIAVGASYIFRLPLYPLILGTYINNPLTLVIIYGFCYKVGKFFLQSKAELSINWQNLSYMDFWVNLKTFFWPFFVGTHIMALFAGFITFFFIYAAIKIYKKNSD
ncbi:MAG: DUF2062 domain-containing protein [Flexistipes sinusarabici]|uniref:DUF2062 domain-containing protein n=1 Tax=Flexistipes sinusarabici TaxID=2352 RepID=A0A5D0MIW0_FLESI|nr:DUF2062 domain-containing protein [Flexistipes sinusarabici]TYB33664.1 MAG: DUF2062 domain-containing protein [Flexistipes sinusarabici]